MKLAAAARGAMHIRPGVEFAGLSDVGCQRVNNEDSCLYWEPDSEQEFQRRGRLAVIADGMGGHEGGQEASRIAVEMVAGVYGNCIDGDPQSWLVQGLTAAHRRIQERAAGDPVLANMGTTCTAIAVITHNLHYAHIGDSRLYMLRNGLLRRVTADHSYVARLVESGLIRPEEALTHPQRHILTAALGAGSDVYPDVPQQPIALETNDTLLLCTDGLWSVVEDDAIKACISAYSPKEACSKLIELARVIGGGPDNITVQILRVS